MSAPDILSTVRNKVRTVASRYGLSGQLLDQVGSGKLLAGIGRGKMVSEATQKVVSIRRSLPVPMLFGEITDNPNINAAVEGFPALRDEGRAVSAYSDSAVYVE